jgi:hypothetical protein
VKSSNTLRDVYLATKSSNEKRYFSRRRAGLSQMNQNLLSKLGPIRISQLHPVDLMPILVKGGITGAIGRWMARGVLILPQEESERLDMHVFILITNHSIAVQHVGQPSGEYPPSSTHNELTLCIVGTSITASQPSKTMSVAKGILPAHAAFGTTSSFYSFIKTLTPLLFHSQQSGYFCSKHETPYENSRTKAFQG